MLFAPNNRQRLFSYHTKMVDLSIFMFCPFSHEFFLHKLRKVYWQVYWQVVTGQTDKPQRRGPTRAKLLDVNITQACKASILREPLLRTYCNLQKETNRNMCFQEPVATLVPNQPLSVTNLEHGKHEKHG